MDSQLLISGLIFSAFFCISAVALQERHLHTLLFDHDLLTTTTAAAAGGLLYAVDPYTGFSQIKIDFCFMPNHNLAIFEYIK